MKFSLSRDELMQPLQRVLGAVERRNTRAVLANVLIEAENGLLTLTASDTEIELSDNAVAAIDTEGSITIPAKKLYDICKSLPDNAVIELNCDDTKAVVKSGRSRFNLSTLPAAQFPKIEHKEDLSFATVEASVLRNVFSKTSFSMAQQDVRYYLNGLLLEVQDGKIRAVTTDGHRLSLSEADTDTTLESCQAIIPRKGVNELIRLLDAGTTEIQLTIDSNHILFKIGTVSFFSKLIDGKFPDYNRVIPSDDGYIATVNKADFKQVLTRVSILANEKYKGVRLNFSEGSVKIQTNNPEQEEAEEDFGIIYSGPEIEVGFNIGYITDVLSVLEGDTISLKISDGNSSCLLTSDESLGNKYVVMPMRL